MKLLTENEVEYLVVGGYAVSFHSRPRYTDDLDIWINKTTENLHKLINTLNQFGFQNISIDESDFLNKAKVYRIGNPPLRIEILNEIDGIKFDDAIKNKVTGKYEDLTGISFISLGDLIKNKKASKRKKDKHDLDYLETYRKKN
ncbi:MAG: nucleotidyltransferase [Chlorobi bacterium]|nr:nucleotidyltransferase [Chlorobiota bacterium]MCI0716245.1 nucleotidyltransferase [Chlorobiota bacterium]